LQIDCQARRGISSIPRKRALGDINSDSNAHILFLTVFKIDIFRRSFLWRGQDPGNIRGGHCLVNWKKCMRPKNLGGLGIKDLDKFSRALQLRWLWFYWDHKERPWKPLLKVIDITDRQLFFCSSEIILGNGKNTPFWEARWLNGMSPKELAPNLFLVPRMKRRTIYKELQNLNWIRNVRDISSIALLEEFILLFMALSYVELSDHQDNIRWKWTEDV
jgi:hypothetical protein